MGLGAEVILGGRQCHLMAPADQICKEWLCRMSLVSSQSFCFCLCDLVAGRSGLNAAQGGRKRNVISAVSWQPRDNNGKGV